MDWRRAAWWVVPAVLLGAAGYELALAFGAYGVGRVPGSGPPGEDVAVVLFMCAALAGCVLALLASSGRLELSRAPALFAPAAAAFVTARFYTYDPYYAPALRRYSDGGAVSPLWIYALLVLSLIVGAAATRLKGALEVTVVLLLLAAGTVVFMGAGH